MTAGRHQGFDRDRMWRFVRELTTRTNLRRVDAIARSAGVSRATGYRYLSDIERLGVLPLAWSPDPHGPGRVVAVDWRMLRAPQ